MRTWADSYRLVEEATRNSKERRLMNYRQPTRHGDITYVADECRVPITTADPLAELAIAADLLAEHGERVG